MKSSKKKVSGDDECSLKDFVEFPVELDGEVYTRVSEISEISGYKMETVLGVLVATRLYEIEQEENRVLAMFRSALQRSVTEGEASLASQPTSPKKSKRRPPKLSTKLPVPKTKQAPKRKPK